MVEQICLLRLESRDIFQKSLTIYFEDITSAVTSLMLKIKTCRLGFSFRLKFPKASLLKLTRKAPGATGQEMSGAQSDPQQTPIDERLNKGRD
jgi:hypothetical protein